MQEIYYDSGDAKTIRELNQEIEKFKAKEKHLEIAAPFFYISFLWLIGGLYCFISHEEIFAGKLLLTLVVLAYIFIMYILNTKPK